MSMHFPFKLIPLPYDYNALEPHIDERTVHIHHDRHHKKYVDDLNKALKPYPSLYNRSLEWLIRNIDALPADIRTPVRNNAGGVFNHNFYFYGMAPVGYAPAKPSGALEKAIMNTFRSLDGFREALKKAALAQFGSGWAWLVLNRNKRLEIVSTPNQDSPIAKGLIPIIAVDVWEHAYYLKYLNERDKYYDNWFNLIDWKQAEEIYNIYAKDNRRR